MELFFRISISRTGIHWQQRESRGKMDVSMTEDSYELLDDLFKDIKLRLAHMRQSDPSAVDEIKGLIVQLELWFDSLVVDSMKMKKLEGLLHGTAELAKGLREKLEDHSRSQRAMKAPDITPVLDESPDTAAQKQA